MVFPSPFGVHVLKSLQTDEAKEALQEVSVPFRGSCSEIGRTMFIKREIDWVSVPFRGSCSEIIKMTLKGARLMTFPSPFGVHVLK